jgi:hypothetical protein
MVLRCVSNIVPLLDLSSTINDLIPKKYVLYQPFRDQGEKCLGNSLDMFFLAISTGLALLFLLIMSTCFSIRLGLGGGREIPYIG